MADHDDYDVVVVDDVVKRIVSSIVDAFLARLHDATPLAAAWHACDATVTCSSPRLKMSIARLVFFRCLLVRNDYVDTDTGIKKKINAID